MYYAVKSGRTTGIYNTWKECESLIKGFSGARFKKFNTREEALLFIGVSGDTHINRDLCDIVYTDGSSWSGKMGLGIFYERRNGIPHDKLKHSESHISIGLSEEETKCTNNRAEALAVEYAIDHLGRDTLILTDSQYCITALMDGLYSTNLDILDRIRLKIKDSPYKVLLEKVAGHAGIPGNEEADRLAGIHTKQ